MYERYEGFIRKCRLFIASIAVFLFSPIYSGTIVYAQSEPVNEPPTESQYAEVLEDPYIYNEATGRWENSTYAWDPATNQTTPLSAIGYSYNPETGRWDSSEWVYDQGTGVYIAPPLPAEVVAPASEMENPSTTVATTDAPSDQQIIEPTSQSLEATSTNNTGNTFFDGFYNPTISVTVESTAQSGDALVVRNTIGGNATSGGADAYVTIMNYLQSSWTSGGRPPATYNAVIQGNYYGDLLLDPERLVANDNSQSSYATEMRVLENGTIENDLDLTASTGNAIVSGNTLAGDASSGDAYAVANIMNFINSSIAANQSFIGTVDVYGNLEGDILIPERLRQQLSAARVPTMELTIDAAISNTVAIDNDITTNARSGAAVVSGNTVAGSAQSGNAATSVTVYNLLGANVSMENGMLVFVNVMGEWIGFITGTPEGSRSALLGTSMTTDYTDTQFEQTYDIETNYLIDNDVDVTAQSGDALVTDNNTAGSATSGDAYAAANISNIINSRFTAANWFGALFINIFGNWNGSFGTDTAFGGFSTTQQPSLPPTGGSTASGNATNNPTVKVFALTTDNTGRTRAVSYGTNTPRNATNETINQESRVEDDDNQPTVLSSTDTDLPAINVSSDSSLPLLSIFGAMVGLLGLGYVLRRQYMGGAA